MIQNPLSKKLLLALPIKKREKIAKDLRQKSKNDNAKKSMQIMDVNDLAVKQALKHADILIHGHTHRPAEHLVADKKRLVLGDWRINTTAQTSQSYVSAVIGVGLNNSTIKLFEFTC